MRTEAKILAALLLLTMLTGCSKGDDDDMTIGNLIVTPADKNSQEPIPSIECAFRGVWAVDNVPADTIDVDVCIGNKKYGNEHQNYVVFYGFPYLAMTKKIIPNVNVAKITTSMRIGGPLPEDENMLLQTIIEHGENYNCMEKKLTQDFRCIGVTSSVVYLELMPGRDYAVLYMPWVVTTKEGDMFPITVSVVPSKSTVIFDTKWSSFSCLLTVSQVEYKMKGELVKQKLETEMKLKYTSIKTIERASLGN